MPAGSRSPFPGGAHRRNGRRAARPGSASISPSSPQSSGASGAGHPANTSPSQCPVFDGIPKGRGGQTRACQRARSLVSPGGTAAFGSQGCSSLLSPGGTVATRKEGRRHLKGAGGEQRNRAQSRQGGTTPAMVALTQRHQYTRSPTAHLRLDLYRVGLSARRQRGSAADQRLVTGRLLGGGADAFVGRRDDRGASTMLIARRDGSDRRGQCQGEAAEDEIHVRSGGCLIVGLGDVRGLLRLRRRPGRGSGPEKGGDEPDGVAQADFPPASCSDATATDTTRPGWAGGHWRRIGTARHGAYSPPWTDGTAPPTERTVEFPGELLVDDLVQLRMWVTEDSDMTRRPASTSAWNLLRTAACPGLTVLPASVAWPCGP